MKILELNPLFKILTLACVFSCLPVLGTVFSGVTAFAHDAAGSHAGNLATTAKDAETAGDQATMKGFLLHAAAHLEILPYEDLSEFRKLLKDDQGIFMSGSVYVIIMDPADGQVFLHGADRSIENRRLLSSEDTDNPDLKELRDGARNDKNGEGFCGEYVGKPACAVIYESSFFSAAEKEPFLLVVGYDFDKDGMESLQYSQLPGGDIVPQRRKAEDVTSREHLKEFVEDTIDAYFIDFLVKKHCDFSELNIAFSPQAVQGLSAGEIKTLLSLVSVPEADVSLLGYCDIKKISLFHPALRAKEGPWRADPIYLFAFEDTLQKESFFNALDKSLEDTDLEIYDATGRDVVELIVEKAKASLEGGFVDYCWDNPSVADDNRRDEAGNPLPGESPGISWKTSYVVKSFSYLGFPPSIVDEKVNDIIVGSGIYPQEGEPPEGCEIFAPDAGQTEPSADDSGCALAGTGSEFQSVALNLFLAVFALFLAVSFRSRAGALQGASSDIRS